MAVQEQTPLQEYTANGIAKQFDLEFDCESADHLIVSIDDLEVLHTDWYLSGNAVAFYTAPANGKQIKIQRNTPFNRIADYQSYNNSFRPPAINKDFDRIWWKLQELGVADWILSNRINALKAYVDDRDDELRAYLMEEIRKQGVALDQLDEYYNYLMQRLAQIAVDKGWDASFVVDGDKNQHQINSGIRERKSVKLWSAGVVDALSKYNNIDADKDEVVTSPVSVTTGKSITSNGYTVTQSTPEEPVFETVSGSTDIVYDGLNVTQDKSTPIAGGTSNNHAMYKFHGGGFNSVINSIMDGQYGISFGYGAAQSDPLANRSTRNNLVAFVKGKLLQGMLIENIGAEATRIIGVCLDSSQKLAFHAIRLSGYNKEKNPSESNHAPCRGIVGSANTFKNVTNAVSYQNSSELSNIESLYVDGADRVVHSTEGTVIANNPQLHRLSFTARNILKAIANISLSHSKFGFAIDAKDVTSVAVDELTGTSSLGFNHYEGVIKDSAQGGAQFRYSHNLYNLQVSGSTYTGVIVGGDYGGGTLITDRNSNGVSITGGNNNLQIVATNASSSCIGVSGSGNVLNIVTDGNVVVGGSNNIITGRIGGKLSGTGTGNKLIGEVVGSITLSGAANDLKQLKGFSGVEQQSITTDATGVATIALSNRNSAASVRHCSVEILNNTSDLRAVIKSISGANVAIKLISKTGADITAVTTVTAMVSWSN